MNTDRWFEVAAVLVTVLLLALVVYHRPSDARAKAASECAGQAVSQQGHQAAWEACWNASE